MLLSITLALLRLAYWRNSLDFGLTCARSLQVNALPEVLRWAREAFESNSSQTDACSVNWQSVATVGHSRGGDIAYHQLQKFEFVTASVLLDPVKRNNRPLPPVNKPVCILSALLFSSESKCLKHSPRSTRCRRTMTWTNTFTRFCPFSELTIGSDCWT